MKAYTDSRIQTFETRFSMKTDDLDSGIEYFKGDYRVLVTLFI